jgi:putative oxidoreductase
MIVARTAAADDFGKLVLRLGVAVIVLFHGIAKVRGGVEWIAEPLAALDLPAFLAYGTYVAEVAAPLLLVAGVWTRLAALIVALDMLMAVLLVLAPQVLDIKAQGGGWAIELEALIFFCAIAVALLGSGRYALAPSRRHGQIAPAKGITVP